MRKKGVLPFLLKSSALCSFSSTEQRRLVQLGFISATSELVHSLAIAGLFFTTGTYGSSHNSLWLGDINNLPWDLTSNVNTFKLPFQSPSAFWTKLLCSRRVTECL